MQNIDRRDLHNTDRDLQNTDRDLFLTEKPLVNDTQTMTEKPPLERKEAFIDGDRSTIMSDKAPLERQEGFIGGDRSTMSDKAPLERQEGFIGGDRSTVSDKAPLERQEGFNGGDRGTINPYLNNLNDQDWKDTSTKQDWKDTSTKQEHEHTVKPCDVMPCNRVNLLKNKEDVKSEHNDQLRKSDIVQQEGFKDELDNSVKKFQGSDTFNKLKDAEDMRHQEHLNEEFQADHPSKGMLGLAKDGLAIAGEKISSAFSTVKDKVMGTTSEDGDTWGNKTTGEKTTGEKVSDALHNVKDKVMGTTDTTRTTEKPKGFYGWDKDDNTRTGDTFNVTDKRVTGDTMPSTTDKRLTDTMSSTTDKRVTGDTMPVTTDRTYNKV